MNKHILNWLNIILKDRFSNDLILDKLDNKLIIKVKDFEGSIIFDKLQKNFLQFNSNFGCIKWNPRDEGYSSILNKPIAAPTSIKFKLSKIEKKKDDYLIHYDILGLAYWSLNRLEEINSTNLDKYKRFDFTYSHAYLYKYLDEPIVDCWFNILSQVINKLWPKISLKKKIFQTIISHDVDRPYLKYGGKNLHVYLRNIASDIINKNLNGYNKLLLSYLPGKKKNSSADPYDTFEWIMDEIEKYNLNSTFNFIFGGSHLKDSYYSVENKNIKKIISSIISRKNNIGAHLSFRCFDQEKLINQELDNFKIYLNSNNFHQEKIITRMHYLRWSTPKTLVYLNNSGVDIDNTLGYSESPGFRCGTCHPYTGYDPVNHKILKITVSPLILMDITLTSNKNLNFEDAYNIAIDLKNKCKKVDGEFTLLWHNSNLMDENRKNLFRSLL